MHWLKKPFVAILSRSGPDWGYNDDYSACRVQKDKLTHRHEDNTNNITSSANVGGKYCCQYSRTTAQFLTFDVTLYLYQYQIG